MEARAAMKMVAANAQTSPPPIWMQNLVNLLQSLDHWKGSVPVMANKEACIAAAVVARLA